MTGRPLRLLAAALAAADRGWPVFPVVPYGKRPAIRGWPHRATCEPHQLTTWWNRAPYNIGIACGPARLLVLDLDQPHSTEPPADWATADVRNGRDVLAVLARRAGQPDPTDTYTVTTPRGEHRYYTVHDTTRSTTGTLGWLIDTRAAGGYVLAAGSVRQIGSRRRYYRHLGHTETPASAPRWILDALVPPPRHVPTAEPLGNRSAYAAAALRDEAGKVRAALPGTRNSTLFIAAYRLGQLAAADLLAFGDIVAALTRASSRHIGTDGFTAAEARTAIDNGLRYGLRRPRHLPNRPLPRDHP